VLDAARQFHAGFSLMIGQPPYSGVLLPALHCASISLELFLKALSAHEIEVPEAAPATGGYIYAQSPSKSHKLEDLFDEAPADIRKHIEDTSRRMLRLRQFRERSSSARTAQSDVHGVAIPVRTE